MKNIKLLRALCIYAVAAFLILVITVTFPQKESPSAETADKTETYVRTEYIYVKNGSELSTEDTSEESCDDVFIVLEYMDMIGIFRPDGTLVETVETYIKTLPEADKRLLKEGFEIHGRRALNSIIEDYS